MSRRLSWTLRQRMVALCAVVGLALVVVAASAAALAASNRSHLDALISTINPVRNAAEQLLSAVVDQETGVRGYAVTGDSADLVPYDSGLVQERELTAEINQMLADEPELQERLANVNAQVEIWRAEVSQPIIERVRAEGTSAARELINESTRERFDQVRTAVESFQEALREWRDKEAAEARETSDRLVFLLIFAAVIVIFAGAALMALLQKLVTQPVEQLAADVRQVAQGDYAHRIRTSGPPELANLAADVDAMRLKIATELGEVREARGQVQWVNEQLQAQAEELTRSNRDLEQFAYVASHDLQEPLRKVASFCQLLQRRYAGQLDERADQYIAFAVDGAQRMQRLINDLLAFSRIGRLTAGFTDIDLNELMAEVTAQISAAREYAKGDVTWDRLPVVEGEEPLLSALFTNLIANSLKFRRPSVPPKVHISARQVDQQWEIAVADNGIGIDLDFADKVFVIFQRLHAKDAYPGTGIGLAIVKKIVEYHGGRVWLDPDVSEGTTIRFTLPSAPVPTGPTGPTAPELPADQNDTDAAAKETVA